MKKILDKILIVIGSAIVAFGICNIHSKCSIAEGGQLGVELLFFNLLGISPAMVSFVIDAVAYLIGGVVFGKKFFSNCIVGTISYSGFYFLFENISMQLFPDLSNHLLIASIFGGIMVGIGCGLVVRNEGACGGDDSIAKLLSKLLKLPIAVSYFLLDLIVIITSLLYISLNQIAYSLITAIISSILIGVISKKKNVWYFLKQSKKTIAQIIKIDKIDIYGNLFLLKKKVRSYARH